MQKAYANLLYLLCIDFFTMVSGDNQCLKQTIQESENTYQI